MLIAPSFYHEPELELTDCKVLPLSKAVCLTSAMLQKHFKSKTAAAAKVDSHFTLSQYLGTE